MAAHNDPGVLTLTLASRIPGLELLDRSCGKRGAWVPLEALMAPDEVMLFAGEQLEAATAGHVRAALHRVVVQPKAQEALAEGRNSVVFELRAPGA